MESVRIEDQTQVAEARRRAVACAMSIGLSPDKVASVALCATEAATNILRHALRGEILIDCVEVPETASVQIIALDKGPGIADIELAFSDGYSTAGTSGTGLGAIKRIASRLEIFAPRQGGTALLAEFSARPQPDRRWTFGAISVPKFGEQICGDSWGIQSRGGVISLIVADGLGHGPLAAEASIEAVKVFRADPLTDINATIVSIHHALKRTRGAAVGLLRLGQDAEFSGVGNIAGGVYNSVDGQRMVSEIGTAGLVARKIKTYTYPRKDFSLAILASDGLATGWSMQPYPALIGHDPKLIAAVLYRDFNRGTDDATVVVLKIGDA